MVGCASIAALGVGLALAMPLLVALFVPSGEVEVPTSFLITLVLFEIIRTWVNTFSTVLTSMSKVRALVVIIGCQSAVTVVLELVLIPKIGIYGPPVGMGLGYLLTSFWMYPYALRRILRNGALSPLSSPGSISRRSHRRL